LQLAQVLGNLARNHSKTIICTIHQPSAEMLLAWQYLVLIGKGSIVYEGPLTGLDSHLCRIGFAPPPPEENITTVEFVVHLMSNDKDVRRLVSEWQRCSGEDGADCESMLGQEAPQLQEVAVGDSALSSRSPLPLVHQILVLTLRHALYTWRTLHGVRGMFARNVLGGIFYGVIYYRNGDELGKLNSFAYPDKEGIVLSPYVYNSVTLCFAVPLFIVVINMVPIPSMFAMSRYCNKEQVSGSIHHHRYLHTRDPTIHI
jgi:hypothetical protein